MQLARQSSPVQSWPLRTPAAVQARAIYPDRARRLSCALASRVRAWVRRSSAVTFDYKRMNERAASRNRRLKKRIEKCKRLGIDPFYDPIARRLSDEDAVDFPPHYFPLMDRQSEILFELF